MVELFNKILDWWAEIKRTIDVNILWPMCKNQSPDLDTARAAFSLHTMIDPAWLRLDEDEVERQIELLR